MAALTSPTIAPSAYTNQIKTAIMSKDRHCGLVNVFDYMSEVNGSMTRNNQTFLCTMYIGSG